MRGHNNFFLCFSLWCMFPRGDAVPTLSLCVSSKADNYIKMQFKRYF